MAEKEGEPMGVFSGWRVDKRIPIVLLGAVLAQSFWFGVYTSNTNSRIESLEKHAATDVQYAVIVESVGNVKSQITALSSDIASVKEDVRHLAMHGKP